MKTSNLFLMVVTAWTLNLFSLAPVIAQSQQMMVPSGQGPSGPVGQESMQPPDGPGGPGSAIPDKNVKNTFYRLGRDVPGVLYEPVTPSSKSQIAILVMHANTDYLSFSACTQMAKRGYLVLCANNGGREGPVSGTETGLDKMISDLRFGVTFLRKYPGVRKVVLWGHSGGGTLVTAYQEIAENGVKVCQGPEKIVKCPNSLANLPRVDGVILADSNWGLSVMTLFALDPAVVSEGNGMLLNPDLNMFNAANGFNPTRGGAMIMDGPPGPGGPGPSGNRTEPFGNQQHENSQGLPNTSNSLNGAKSDAGSTYSQAFIQKFLSAQGKRYGQLVKAAQNRMAAINSGKGNYVDDEPFIVTGAANSMLNSKLYARDTRLMSRTAREWPLLHADGTTTTQVVYSVRVPDPARPLTSSFSDDGALRASVREFLNTYAIRVNDDYGYDEDAVRGVDWTSSYNNPPGNVQAITVPMLVMGMTGHFEYLAAETIFQNAKSFDKSLVFVEGASHGYETCDRCEKTRGQYGDTTKTTYDYADKWLSQNGRF